jgi:type IV pilus assembly protein PilB
MTAETTEKTKKIGKYRILRELGHGGMAVVYEAYDEQNDRKVALKTLPSNLVDRKTVARFHREGKAQADLNHDNIVKVYDVGTADNTHYIALELISGKTVRNIIRKSGHLGPDKTLRIARQVCDALAFAHSQLYIHRDIKSGNIMIDETGNAKVLDFGLVQITGMTIMTQTGNVVGTPEYMSPEQIAGQDVDARTDLYSLGVTMYEMLTGSLPFTGDSPQKIASQVRFEEAAPVTDIVPTVPKPVETVVARALAKSPEERFQSAEEMAAAINECAHPSDESKTSSKDLREAILNLDRQDHSPDSDLCGGFTSAPANRSLAAFLVQKGLLQTPQIEEVYLKQIAQRKTSFREQAHKLGLIDEDGIANLSSEWCGIPVSRDIAEKEMDQQARSLIPQKVAERFRILPLLLDNARLVIGMVNPLDVFAIDYLEILADTEVQPVIISHSEYKLGFEKFYEQGQKYKNILNELGVEDEKEMEIVDEEEEAAVLDIDQETASEAPIIKLVNYMIQQAIRDRASDIHIEPEESKLRVRYRVDGALQEAMRPPKDLQTAIVSRIKIMADLDIAERRIPQDGRIKLRIDNRNIDLRVSTLPGIHGEKVVIRILDEANMVLNLTDLGFEETDLECWQRIIRQPYGIALVTGPTGSGKTTALYSSLRTINSPDTNIITVEDPVEYRLEGITQVQVNPKAGITFASGLRSIFRQDPDVVLVGEMRDLETAQISVKASLTGHLVFSTLHANDAPGTIARLLDMGVAPYLIASSLLGALAQRLIRVICPFCKEPYQPSPRELELAAIEQTADTPGFFRAKGCQKCGQSGYRGRTAIFELMEINEELKRLIVARKPTSELMHAARKAGMKTLREQGMRKVYNGITTLDELIKRTSLYEEETDNAGVQIPG